MPSQFTPQMRRRWRKCVEGLNHLLPCPLPVRVERVSRSVGWGFAETIKTDKGFLIRVRNDASWAESLDALIHEWAHARRWEGRDKDTDHPDEWGVEYARAYRAHRAICSDWSELDQAMVQ